MSNVTLIFYVNNDTFGVLVTASRSIYVCPSVAQGIAQYKDTCEDYSKRKGTTWGMSTSLFRMEMETNVFLAEVEGDAFLEMMSKRDHYIKRVGNQACPLDIAELTEEEVSPYFPNLICLTTGKPREVTSCTN